jgi:hypothetical protein
MWQASRLHGACGALMSGVTAPAHEQNSPWLAASAGGIVPRRRKQPAGSVQMHSTDG